MDIDSPEIRFNVYFLFAAEGNRSESIVLTNRVQICFETTISMNGVDG